MKEDLLKGLTDEQITRVKNCNNSEELLAMAKQEGVELSDEQLNAISGGCYNSSSVERYEIDNMQCPECLNSHCMEKVSDDWYRCKYCCKITINKNIQ